MQMMPVKKYMEKRGISRQAIWNMKMRGNRQFVTAEAMTPVEHIVLTEKEIQELQE